MKGKSDAAAADERNDEAAGSAFRLRHGGARAGLGGEHGARDRLIEAGYRDIRDPTAPEVSINPKTLVENPPKQWTIKEEDKKYIAFRVDLLDQLPKQRAEYDREQVEVLKEIRD